MEGKYLTLKDRIKIETLLKHRFKPVDIARDLGCCVKTVYNEIKRGQCEQIIKDIPRMVYLADVAHNRYLITRKRKGCKRKLDTCPTLVSYIEDCIGKKQYSPDVTANLIKKDIAKFNGVSVSVHTIYNYLDRDYFKTISNQSLIVKSQKSKKEKKTKKISYRMPKTGYRSIDARPQDINSRDTCGHWEMDTVYSAKDTSKTALLVLTDRKSRFEIIRQIPDRTMLSVKNALDDIEDSIGHDAFKQHFKSITIDNGSEFAQPDKIETGKHGKRTITYYCHPYSSWERGSNENMNRLIRWYIPKGADIGQYTPEEIQSIQDWLNNYPRRLLGYKSPLELYENEVGCLTRKEECG